VAGRGRRYGQGSFWGDQIGPNPTDRGNNGVKRSLLVEADGGPLAAVIAGANVPDFKLLKATLEAMVVERPEPTEEAPQHLCLDKGRATINSPLGKSWRSTTTRRISDASEKRRRTRRERSVIQLDDG
jgi:hypothetical protein